MITVHFIGADGADTALQCRPGRSLMRAAVDAGLDGIAADCGGMMTCGTCHVFVRERYAGRLPPMQAEEHAMLEFTAVPRRANSRLSCQLLLSQELDGLTVDLPDTQY